MLKVQPDSTLTTSQQLEFVNAATIGSTSGIAHAIVRTQCLRQSVID